jgi:hypothetical protein
MNTETVLARILAGVTELLKQVVSQAESREAPPTLYEPRGPDPGGSCTGRTSHLASIGGGARSRRDWARTALCVW